MTETFTKARLLFRRSATIPIIGYLIRWAADLIRLPNLHRHLATHIELAQQHSLSIQQQLEVLNTKLEGYIFTLNSDPSYLRIQLKLGAQQPVTHTTSDVSSESFTASAQVQPGVATVVNYTCNLCGTANRLEVSEAWREGSFCAHCKSNARYRLIVHALSVSLFGQSLGLMDIPENNRFRGIGLSDWEGFAQKAEVHFDYVNTYFHKEPKLDIVSEHSAGGYRGLDFVISSEVFEHVPQPVQRAFSSAYSMLKPGGVLIFSAPYTNLGTTLERFPQLYDYSLEERESGGFFLRNVTREGVTEEFENLIFHGGEGQTVEMRVFCEQDLWLHLRKAGFSRIELFDQPVWERGIYWKSAYHEYVKTELGGYVFAATKEPSYKVEIPR